jgi:hypothetical protein
MREQLCLPLCMTVSQDCCEANVVEIVYSLRFVYYMLEFCTDTLPSPLLEELTDRRAESILDVHIKPSCHVPISFLSAFLRTTASWPHASYNSDRHRFHRGAQEPSAGPRLALGSRPLPAPPPAAAV